jgi:hypothetical protein
VGQLRPLPGNLICIYLSNSVKGPEGCTGPPGSSSHGFKITFNANDVGTPSELEAQAALFLGGETGTSGPAGVGGIGGTAFLVTYNDNGSWDATVVLQAGTTDVTVTGTFDQPKGCDGGNAGLVEATARNVFRFLGA